MIASSRWSNFYSSPSSGPTSRRATDVLVLVAALAGLGLLIVAYPPGPFERTFATFLESFPGWLDPVWRFLFDLLALWAIALVVLVGVSRRGQVVLLAVSAFAAAAVLAIVSTRLALGHWPDIGLSLAGGSSSPVFPIVRVAEAGAVVLTVGAQLVRRLERVGHWLIGLGLLGGLVLHPTVPSGTLASILVAVAAAAAVRLAFGTSLGRPGVAEVAAALRELGVRATGLEAAQRQVAGVHELEAVDDGGQPLVVKVYGRNAYDNQLLATFWRKLWYQDGGPAPGLSRVQAVEHEALVTLLAIDAGVPTRKLVKAGATVGGDALLVLRGVVRPLSGLPDPDRVALGRYWHALANLRGDGIAHREISPSTVALVDGDPGLIDFGGATVTPTPDQLESDCAQLLASTAAVVGSERAIEAAVDALGVEGVATLLPYLQPPTFSGPLRSALKANGIDTDELRSATAAAVGAPEPELAKLRRVTWGSIIQIALLLLAVGAVLKVAGNVDYDQLKSDLVDATWGWIIFGFVFAQLPRLTQAVGALGSIAAKLRFGPVYVLQLATSYLNLAVPSSVARMAVDIRFFQRQGLPAAAAVTAGVIESFAGNVLQAVLVLVLVMFTSADLSLGLTAPGSSSLTLLWIVIGIAVVVVLVVVLVPRLRRAIVDRLRVWLPQVKSALGALRASNKLLLLIGGNLATEILFATALGLMCRGLGYHIPLNQLIVINSGISLFSSFIPVPGGIGVVEFGLEVGLTSAGMTSSAAAAAIIMYRLATFYLPPIWGFFAFRWLQRHSYL
jgi:glycosyltransferase 2 family protein